MSATSVAVTVIVAFPAFNAVIVIVPGFCSVGQTNVELTFTILESDDDIVNFPSQLLTDTLNVVVPPSVNDIDDFETVKLPAA